MWWDDTRQYLVQTVGLEILVIAVMVACVRNVRTFGGFVRLKI